MQFLRGKKAKCIAFHLHFFSFHHIHTYGPLRGSTLQFGSFVPCGPLVLAKIAKCDHIIVECSPAWSFLVTPNVSDLFGNINRKEGVVFPDQMEGIQV